jgi:diaminohydroxyphosphoribosylaminopyrimidine deaminase/5-amino-6-(5-phosphoribosylamino)uracil reductase
MSEQFSSPEAVMRRALDLAAQGIGQVEPNPAVGAVIVDDELNLLGAGYHQRCGGPHAEVHAIGAAGARCRGATLFITLEPCSHQGRTPPCAPAVVAAGLRKVVVAMQDPAPHVNGAGIALLRQAGLDVEVGLLGEDAARLVAPFVKLMTRGLPWVHAKWAMTLDGKIASRTGDSRWISGESSRRVVHQLRGRMDAVVVGIGTALADDPLLTARPAGPRTATRIVVDTSARLPLTSQLVRTARDAPVIVAVASNAEGGRCRRLEEAGVEVLRLDQPPSQAGLPLESLLEQLGVRRMTNVLVEGGATLLGALFDRQLIDECHVFLAPQLLGGRDAPTPLAGVGLDRLASAARLDQPQIEVLDGDVYVHGPLLRR